MLIFALIFLVFGMKFSFFLILASLIGLDSVEIREQVDFSFIYFDFCGQLTLCMIKKVVTSLLAYCIDELNIYFLYSFN